MNKIEITTQHKDLQKVIFVSKENLSDVLNEFSLSDKVFFEAEKNDVVITKQKDKKWFLVGLEDVTEYAKLKGIAKNFSFEYRKKFNTENTEIVFPEKLNAEQIKALFVGIFEGTYEIQKNTENTFVHPFWNEDLTLNLFKNNTNLSLEQIALEARYIVEGKFLGMDLLNLPPNQKNSEILAEFAQEFATNNGLNCTIFGKEESQEKGLHSFLSVNQGSAFEPAFIILEYKPENPTKKVGLVGKCVTFDTGGISIKPSQNMHYMKSDMGGACAVLGTLLAASKLKLSQHIIAILPATDNAVDKEAYLPGDVINSYAGKTIEVINTDAEGRMTLADGLAYMNDIYSPDVLLDIATLTGSAVRTLGYKAAAMLTVSDEISNDLSKIGNNTGEKVWRLPLWDEYLEDLKSDVADLKHISNTPLSDVIYAAKFLQQFTNEHQNWIHLDIAGVAFGNNAYSKDKSATGYGIELLINFLKSLN